MEVYLPKMYLDEEIMQVFGNKISTIGIFNFRIFSSEDKKEKSRMNTYTFSSIIEMHPSSFDVEKLEIFDELEEDSFITLKFYKGDVFIDDLRVVKQTTNTELFLKILNAGKIPRTIKYDRVLKLLLTSMNINGVNFGVPSTVLEVVITEIYRNRENLGESYRFFAGSGKSKSLLDYETISLKAVSYHNSTFTALTFEDFDYALVTSVNKTKYDKTETVSPVEKVIKY